MIPHHDQGISFEEIQPLSLAGYAQKQGWKRVKTKRVKTKHDSTIVYAHPEEGRYEQLLIPRHSDIADYAERIHDAIATLADYEKREWSEVYQDILCTGWVGQGIQDGS